MTGEWHALRRGESPRERKRLLERAHERFLEDAALVADAELQSRFARQRALRSVVMTSWVRARQRNLNPNRAPGAPALTPEQLQRLQREHPMTRVLPVINQLLIDEATASGFIVAVGDAAGRLLWINGDHRLRARAEDMGFAVGTDWSEEAVGTSAPGSALSLNHSIQVLGAEHYNRAVHQWSCTATPVHDPATGAIVGVIDVTGSDAAASPQILPLVEATRAAVEAELKLLALRAAIEREQARERAVADRGRPHRIGAKPRTPRLMVLGRDPCVLELDAGLLPVAGRHAEILLALAAAPQGLSAAALTEQVYGDAASELTLRPELVRLRRWLAKHPTGVQLLSRPYRLSGPVAVDAREVLEALSRGAHRLAFAAYHGPVLPFSSAPAVDALRTEVDVTLREAMLQCAGADLLFAYATTWANEDAEVWEALLRILPARSPKRARVVAQLERLAAEEGAAAGESRAR